MFVADFMSPRPIQISPDEDLAEALAKMGKHKIRHLVVVSEDGTVKGILSDRDLAMYYDPMNMTEERWKQARVKDLMTRDPDTIGSLSPIRSAAKLILSLAISALPVVDNGQLKGLLTERDFVRHFAELEE